MRLLILLYFLLTLGTYALPQTVEKIIRNSGIAKKDVSIYIKQTDKNGKVIVSHNATTSRTPASVIKVMTTYASILKLGFDYRFPTRFYRTGTLDNGILHGDLVIKGFGDPTLNSKNLKSIVSQIAQQGIKKIMGNIVIDRSFFRVGTKDSSGFDENTYSAYNAMPDAMMYNERISTICVIPNRNNVTKKGADGSYKVNNRLKPVNKPCKGRYSWPGVRIDKSHAVPLVQLQGKISKRCGQRNICKVVTKPYKSFYYALKDKLEASGITVSGEMRIRTVPSNAIALFTHYSDRLEKIVSKTAKKSNNLYARHLLLFLGAKMYGAPASLNKGRKAVKTILQNNGALSSGTLIIDNGCGLSRTAKLSAKMLADMFDNAYERYGQRWMNTLSIAGVDGTIKKRFRGTVLKGRAWMKTGTLKRVKNISGYVKSKSGQLYTAVILIKTNQGRWKAAQLENEVLKWLATYKGTRKNTVSKQDMGNKKPISQLYETMPKRYYVQLGSFSELPEYEYFQKIKKLELRYKILFSDKYKILVGPYEVEKNAKNVLEKVRSTISEQAFVVKL